MNDWGHLGQFIISQLILSGPSNSSRDRANRELDFDSRCSSLEGVQLNLCPASFTFSKLSSFRWHISRIQVLMEKNVAPLYSTYSRKGQLICPLSMTGCGSGTKSFKLIHPSNSKSLQAQRKVQIAKKQVWLILLASVSSTFAQFRITSEHRIIS